MSSKLKKTFLKKTIYDDNINVENVFTGTLDSVVKKIQKVKKQLENKGWKELRSEISYFHEGFEFVLTGMILETDGELKFRQKKEERKQLSAKKKEEKQKELYLKLHKKFSDEG